MCSTKPLCGPRSRWTKQQQCRMRPMGRRLLFQMAIFTSAVPRTTHSLCATRSGAEQTTTSWNTLRTATSYSCDAVSTLVYGRSLRSLQSICTVPGLVLSLLMVCLLTLLTQNGHSSHTTWHKEGRLYCISIWPGSQLFCIFQAAFRISWGCRRRTHCTIFCASRVRRTDTSTSI